MRSIYFLVVRLLIFILSIGFFSNIIAQTQVIRAIHYKQITSFETDPCISSMKISWDGSRIVFGTSGPAVKVFTMNVDGSDLIEVFDFERTGSGPFVDISGDGDRIVWYDGYGNMYSSYTDGGDRHQLAALIPHPDPQWADFIPDITLGPRITSDGSKVFFLIKNSNPLAAGLWRVNTDGTNLEQIFNYYDVSEKVYGLDGSEFEFNLAFADGFSISADGSTVMFGNKIFHTSEGDITRGDAIVLKGTTFYNLGEYACGIQPFATDLEGNDFYLFKREINPTTGDEEINIYHDIPNSIAPIKLMGGMSVYATSQNVQTTVDGTMAIVLGGMGAPHEPPITLVDAFTKSHIDLVNVDGASIALGGFRMSLSKFVSINGHANTFCFMSQSFPPQIWIGRLYADARTTEPSITNVTFTPNFVYNDFSSTSTFEARVMSSKGPITSVQFSALRDGMYWFRAICSGFPFTHLVDDGTFGDNANDGLFTNNDVHIDLLETPPGDYTVRIDATDGVSITAVDAEPFLIRENTTGIEHRLNELPKEFDLLPNYPNPFNPTTHIKYQIPEDTHISVKIFNSLGQEMTTLVDEEKKAGYYTLQWNASKHTSGLYFVSMKTEEYSKIHKMMLIK